jgi:hypothetical protein
MNPEWFTHRPAPPRQPQRGELLFEFLVGHDRTLDPLREQRGLAIAWAIGERDAIEADARHNS